MQEDKPIIFFISRTFKKKKYKKKKKKKSDESSQIPSLNKNKRKKIDLKKIDQRKWPWKQKIPEEFKR